jgi:hypothetical protein
MDEKEKIQKMLTHCKLLELNDLEDCMKLS